jgi:SAM-dependent methyltransferase
MEKLWRGRQRDVFSLERYASPRYADGVLKETRTVERLSYQYEIERRLAARLRDAGREDRRHLYADVYNEFFRAVPDHPQLVCIADPVTQARDAARRAQCLSRFLTPQSVFLEMGPGDCALAIKVAQSVRKVYAVDVSAEITKSATLPDNFELILSDGSSVPVAPNSVDVAFSDQLMEHLHPDDAMEQLRNLYRALKPGGVYVCVTPNRFSGPHDVSKYFTDEPTGFHLQKGRSAGAGAPPISADTMRPGDGDQVHGDTGHPGDGD